MINFIKSVLFFINNLITYTFPNLLFINLYNGISDDIWPWNQPKTVKRIVLIFNFLLPLHIPV